MFSVFLFLVWQVIGSYMVASFVAQENGSGLRNIREGDITWGFYVLGLILAATLWPIPKYFPRQTHKFIHWLV